MTRTIAALCLGVACSVTVAAAQSGGAMADDKMAKQSPTVTVTGCVAEGTMADHYMLNNATVSTGEMMKNDAMSADHPASFALQGGDLKPHVGHKVEVTGMLVPKGEMKTETKTKVGDDTTKHETIETESDAPQFRVIAIKNLAERCE